MKCANPGCTRRARPGHRLCDRCREGYRRSDLPLKEGRRDIERLRKSTGHFRRSSSLPPDDEFLSRSLSRSQGKEKESDESSENRKRQRSVSPTPRSKRQRIEPSPSSPRDESDELVGSSKRSGPVELPLLFIPFEGNFNRRIMGGYQSVGNQSSSIFETGESSFYIERGKQRLEGGSMQSTVGSSDHWSGKKGSLQKMPLLSGGKSGFQETLEDEQLSPQDFYQMVVEDRLRQLLFTQYSGPEHGLPEVIVLSERLLAWPDRLQVLGRLYRRHRVLGRTNVQDMAAFVLESSSFHFAFEVRERSSSHGGKSFTETWLLVRKRTVSPALTVACVHLSSNYTKVKTPSMGSILDQLISFARTRGIHAIVGDFNMNTYGIHGGSFPVSNDFVIKDKTPFLKSTFASSSGSGTSVYMGGMICDSRVAFRPTLTTFGNSALAPWFVGGTFKGKVFSDHHSLYCRYAFYGEGARRRPSPPFGEGGGDCFFYALRRRLRTTENVLALRQRIIDLITDSVAHEPNMSAPRAVLVQRPFSDAAVPLWCPTPEAFMAEMRQSGRWVDDSLVPFIAQALGRRFLIQYDDHYAVFETDGTRHDEPGEVVQGEDDDIFMYCQGYHFW